MTLVEILSKIIKNIRYKMSPDEITVIIDMVQKIAFDQDLQAFKTQVALPIYTEVPVLESGFTVSTDDIGTILTQATSGFTGTLRGFFNDSTNSRFSLVIERDNDADDWNAANLAITGGAVAATSDSTKDQADANDFKGPYPFPTSPPCRKILGISTLSDARIYGGQFTYLSQRDDYGLCFDTMPIDERRFYLPNKVDAFKKWITLINSPQLDSPNLTYRFWYFRTVETITDVQTDDALFLVDPEYHMNFVGACTTYCRQTLNNEPVNRDVIDQFFKDWWDGLRLQFLAFGKNSNEVNEPNI